MTDVNVTLSGQHPSASHQFQRADDSNGSPDHPSTTQLVGEIPSGSDTFVDTVSGSGPFWYRSRAVKWPDADDQSTWTVWTSTTGEVEGQNDVSASVLVPYEVTSSKVAASSSEAIPYEERGFVSATGSLSTPYESLQGTASLMAPSNLQDITPLNVPSGYDRELVLSWDY